ncbi:MAG: lipoyl synthase [Prevotellaceae bacterium]|nr:lipoyl synthase [Prevotellaceae bacterium]
MEEKKSAKAGFLRKPKWLYTQIEGGEKYGMVEKIVKENNLHTICSSGKCPNKGHCWKCGTATFMILGDRCTRACRFCATATGHPLPPEPEEPKKVARSVKLMQLKHCVVTSVDRDDLPDKGAAHWAETVREIRRENPEVVIEVLIPDYRGENLQTVLDAKPDIVAHNMETIERLTPTVRSKATYRNSLAVLQETAERGFITKTGIMVGLGETQEEVEHLLHEVYDAGCRMITIGQYLRPGEAQIEVAEYVHPDIFQKYKETALAIGFDCAESAPFVRSSFMAEQSFVGMLVKKKQGA